jgi:hypothetical protein
LKDLDSTASMDMLEKAVSSKELWCDTSDTTTENGAKTAV